MKNRKYHTVGTVEKQYNVAKSISLTHKYMTVHFPG